MPSTYRYNDATAIRKLHLQRFRQMSRSSCDQNTVIRSGIGITERSIALNKMDG